MCTWKRAVPTEGLCAAVRHQKAGEAGEGAAVGRLTSAKKGKKERHGKWRRWRAWRRTAWTMTTGGGFCIVSAGTWSVSAGARRRRRLLALEMAEKAGMAETWERAGTRLAVCKRQPAQHHARCRRGLCPWSRRNHAGMRRQRRRRGQLPSQQGAQGHMYLVLTCTIWRSAPATGVRLVEAIKSVSGAKTCLPPNGTIIGGPGH